MSEKLLSTNISPEDTGISNLIRWCKIHVGGKVLHTLVGGGKSLSDTFQGFLKTTNIGVHIDELSAQAIEGFCENEYGAMILNHPNNNFADYIPLLAQIPEEILAKTTFFAVKHTVPMFRREFGDKYNFVEASFDSISEAKRGLHELEKAIEKVNSQEGYIFIIPGGAESEDSEIHESFKALFKRMAQNLDSKVPLLVSKIKYPDAVTYGKVYKRAFAGRMKEFYKDEGREPRNLETGNNDPHRKKSSPQEQILATITSKLMNIGAFLGSEGEATRERYEETLKG